MIALFLILAVIALCPYHDSTSKTGLFDIDKNGISDKLAKWATAHNITRVALKDLIDILKSIILGLPKDPRTLLSFPRNYMIKNIGNGVYYHFGIKNYIAYLFQNEFQAASNKIRLKIDIDGVLMYKSTKEQFWPIVGKISLTVLIPFIVGLFVEMVNLMIYMHIFQILLKK